jgi:hypothetical protein
MVSAFFALKNCSKICGFSRITEKHCYNSIAVVRHKEFSVNAILKNFKKKYPNIIFIAPSKIICDQRYCYSSLDGIPLYYDGEDDSHLDFTGSKLVGNLYLKKYENPFSGQK